MTFTPCAPFFSCEPMLRSTHCQSGNSKEKFKVIKRPLTDEIERMLRDKRPDDLRRVRYGVGEPPL